MARDFPEGAVGAFADLGGELTVLSINWVPEPQEVAARLVAAANYYDNMLPPLMASKAISIADMQAHFDTESAPDGSAWAPLDPEYLAKKTAQGYDSHILRRTTDMMKAATSEAAYIVDGNDLFFSTSGLPDYWGIAQEGTGPGGSRVLGHQMKVTKSKKAGLEYTGSSHESQDIGRGMDTPARPFVGLSAEAELQIIEVFDLWFAAGFSVAVGKSGAMQERVGGRFGQRLYPDVGALN